MQNRLSIDDSGHRDEIASLRMRGADRLDPVRFHFIETLARRAPQHKGAVKRILEGKLTDALGAYRERLEQATNTITHTAKHAVAEKTYRLSPLAGLARHIAQHSPEYDEAGLAEGPGPRPELKAVRNFRNTWSKLSVDKQLRQAIEQAPENAGPLNSHGLVLQSLASMRDISPDYLKRFMSYADSLLWLDQADRTSRPMSKKSAAAKTTKS